MRTVMRPRYYCDHCKKGTGSASFMKRHERGCTLNPQRVCGMCQMLAAEGGPDPAPPRDELVRVLDTKGFAAMRADANDCPACILTALRTKNYRGDAESPGGVSGPEDGRNEWNYRTAKEAWWKDWNSAQEERREWPY
jgi:hypothetical protein